VVFTDVDDFMTSTATVLAALVVFAVNFWGCNDSESVLRDSKQAKVPGPFGPSETTA
jgi:hypothetical protein